MKNRSAFSFVLIIGIVNLFADLTYEGARGIVGPFLGSLGASAAIVGFVAGFGELMGYALRSVSGYFADKTHKYWAVAFTGYAINMLAVPALALAGQWPVAAGLVVAERTGRAIRKPVVEAMLSHAGRSIGAGWVFGLNEALDQAGAGTLLAAGFADFALIGFHFHKANTVAGNLIPVFYAVAMASSALASIPLGRLFDRFGGNIALLAFFISAAAAPFVFLGSSGFALIGMIFWGIGMSAQGSLFQAMLTGVIPPEKRSTAFGLFDTGYGIAWFLGSAAMGLLYEKSILAVALFSVILQLAALPVLFIANKKR